MAGSDFFRRTWRDQAGWPAETAKPGALVQIAVVYRGRQVIIYRNGLQYASYEIAKPQAFGVDAMVLIGLRYVGDMGEIGFFEGSIDDARIYDLALTPEQIASLKPNEASNPRPLAWWDFENARATDRMGRFSACRLMGEARIADGKLSLDGDGYLWAAKDEKSLTLEPEEETLDRTVHTMFYKARSKKTGNMWDVWLYHHQGTYFLYYMMFGHYPIMVTLVADRPEGPFHRAKRNYRVLTGHTYFSRFFPHPDGMLACHFTKARNGQWVATISFSGWRQLEVPSWTAPLCRPLAWTTAVGCATCDRIARPPRRATL